MVPLDLPLLVATDTVGFVRGTSVAIIAFVVVVVIVGAVSFVVLFRRGGDRGIRGTSAQAALESRTAGLLVMLDDRVREADNELGFAIAQFGPTAAHDFAQAVSGARAQLTEAFRLSQQRDTTSSSAAQLRRRLALQSTALCEQALASLERYDTAFAQRRQHEVSAAVTAEQLSSDSRRLRNRLEAAAASIIAARERYSASVIAAPQRQHDECRELTARADSSLAAAAAGISPSGVNAVADELHSAATLLHRAGNVLANAERSLAELVEADAAVSRMREASDRDAHEARVARDSAPDPQSAARIQAAISSTESALEQTASHSGAIHDPFAQLALLSDASTELDTALASARNQQQRFEHARAAYQGTLVAARSQIAVVRELVGRGGVSARARTRLAEAERQLMIAEAETDPVEALDAIRRSVTHARDADALARY